MLSEFEAMVLMSIAYSQPVTRGELSKILAMSEKRVVHAAIRRSQASSMRSGSLRTDLAMNHEA